MSGDSGLHPVTRDLLVAVDRFVGAMATTPTRLPQWVADGMAPPQVGPEEDAYDRCVLPVARAVFDDTLAVALWYDFWILVEQVGGLIEQIGGVSFDRPASSAPDGPFTLAVRPVMLGPQPRGVVGASMDDALATVVLTRMSSATVGDPGLSGVPGSSENLVGLVALTWMRSMLERGLMTLMPGE